MGYGAANWTDLFVATAGAAAALAGLVFVAVSINLERILEQPRSPIRAIQTLVILISLLLLSILALTPGDRISLGVEILALGVVTVGIMVVTIARTHRLAGEPWVWVGMPAALALVGSVPIVLCGLSLLVHTGGGLYWALIQIVLGFVAAAVNAWVLLVEIVR